MRRGTCQRCKTEQWIGRGKKPDRIVEHNRPDGLRHHCPGSSMRSVEDCAPDREKARAARSDSIERVRIEATVALDAYQYGRAFVDGKPIADAAAIARYRKLALTAYRLLHLRSQPDRQCVKWHGHVNSRGHRDLKGPRVDVFCVFCGHRIATFPKAYYARTDANWAPIERHTTICALAVVAGLLVPVKPHTMIVDTGQVTIAEVVPIGDGPLFGERT